MVKKQMNQRNFLNALLVSLLLTGSSNFNAQIFAGANVGYNLYFQETGIKFLSVGMLVEKQFTSGTVQCSFNYGFTYKEPTTFSIYNALKTPTVIYVNGVYKYLPLNLSADYRYIFGGNDLDDGGFSVFAGLGISMIRISFVHDSFDETYAKESNFNYKESYFTPVWRIGIGYDYAFGFGNVSVNAFSNIPINRLNSTSQIDFIPMLVGFNVGVKIPIHG